MMGRALLIIGWLATAGIVAAGVVGYTAERASPSMTPHILLAFTCSLLILFSHCWIMFYLIGTGRAIREAVEEYDLNSKSIEDTKAFKNDCYPWLMAAMAVAIAAFVLGGGAYAAAVPSWVHHVLFYLLLLVQVRTLAIEGRVLLANEKLMNGIDSAAATPVEA